MSRDGAALSLAEGLRLPKESLAAERRAAFEKKGSLEQGSECILVTIERDPHAATLAMEYFAQSVYAPHIHLVRGDAGKALLNIHRAMGKKPSGATGESTASEASLLNEGDYYCPGRDRARTKKEPRTCRRGDDTRRTDSTSRGAEMTGDEANNQDKQETPLPKAERGPALSVDWTAEGGDVRRKGAATCMTTGRGEQMSYQDRLRGSLLFSEDLLPVSFSLPQLQKRSNLADEGICALPLPPDGFDLIFLDADKRNYGEYLHLILHPEKPLLARDGVLIVDNVLFTASRKNDWRASSTQEITEQENRLDESQRTLRPGNSAGEAAVAGTATGEREVEEKEEKTAHGGQSADSKKATERLRSRRTARLIKIEEEMKRVRKLLLNDERVVHVRPWRHTTTEHVRVATQNAIRSFFSLFAVPSVVCEDGISDNSLRLSYFCTPTTFSRSPRSRTDPALCGWPSVPHSVVSFRYGKGSVLLFAGQCRGSVPSPATAGVQSASILLAPFLWMWSLRFGELWALLSKGLKF